eukprot:1159522-Pelagomonas_calceolata.AAC.13
MACALPKQGALPGRDNESSVFKAQNVKMLGVSSSLWDWRKYTSICLLSKAYKTGCPQSNWTKPPSCSAVCALTCVTHT